MRILFPFVWWQEMKLYRYFRRWHEFPNGMPTLNRFRIQCWMWNFEIQFLPLVFHQNLQFYGWLEETAHLHFAGPLSSVSPASPVPQTQSWPSWTGKRIPVYAGRNGLEFILLSRIECPGMSRDTNFPTEASGWWTASTVYIHTIKLGSTSFLIFIPVFYQAWSPDLNPTAFGGSCDKNSYSLFGVTLPLHTSFSPHSPSGSIFLGHFQPSDTAPYALIFLNTSTAAWNLLTETGSKHPA